MIIIQKFPAFRKKCLKEILKQEHADNPQLILGAGIENAMGVGR